MGIFKDMGNSLLDLFKQSVDKNAENELINQLKRMDEAEKKKYYDNAQSIIDDARPEDKTFEYLEEYVPIDEKTLREQSTKEFEQYYDDEKKKANEKYDAKVENVEKKEQQYKQDAVRKSEQYTEDFDDKKDSFKSAASKNGIADSSINTSKQKAIDDERDDAISQVLRSLQDKLDASALSKQNYIEQKNNKLTALDEKFSKDVESYLKQLINEENKKVKEVQDANKKTAQEEDAYKKYQESKVKEAQKLVDNGYKNMKEAEKLGDYGSLERKNEFANRLKMAMEFYGQYAPSSVYNSIFGNKTLMDLLGGEYYKLLKEYQ